MNTINKFILLVLIIFSTGCTTEEGRVFLKFKSILTPTNVFIDCLDIPTDFQYDVYYEINPGIYPFTYTDHNNVIHPLIGEIKEVNAIPYDSEEDLHIDLILLSTGAIIENF